MINQLVNPDSIQPLFEPNRRHLHVQEIAHDQIKILPGLYAKIADQVLITPTNHLFVNSGYVVAGTKISMDSRELSPFQQVYLYIKYKFFTKKINHSINGLWVHNSWSNNYYHWLCEVLPRIDTLKELYPDFNLILPIELKRFGFVNDALQTLAIPCCWIDQTVSNVFPMLGFLENEEMSPDVNPMIQVKLVKKILNALSLDQERKPFRKVYISRINARYRKIRNEHELIPVLVERGYEIILPENLSYQQQIQLFSETKSLISIHGAGHTNCMFMQKGTRVMEIRNKQWDSQPLCFWRLANIFELNWDYFLAEESTEVTNFNDVTVDVKSFISKLDFFETL